METRGTKRTKGMITRIDPEDGTACFELEGDEVSFDSSKLKLGRSKDRSLLRVGCEVSCLVHRANGKLRARDVWIVHSPDERARRR